MSDAREKSLEGIGGWLILPLLGLIVTPIQGSLLLYQEYLPVFTEGYWDVLTTPGSEAYRPFWRPLLVGEIIGIVTVVVLSLVALYFFLRRSRLAPRPVIAWLAFSVIFVTTAFFIAKLIPEIAEQSETDTLKGLVSVYVPAVIWIPYFVVSERVKRTFTR